MDFEALMHNREMNLPVVRKYLHLLDLRNEDFEQVRRGFSEICANSCCNSFFFFFFFFRSCCCRT